MEFTGFNKIPRLKREVVITEKLDGTNAQIKITDEGEFLVGSRNRWIIPGDDNYAFAKWAMEHKEELMKLGVGSHFGEWWGQGIARKYDLKEKRFSLFNTARWCLAGAEPEIVSIVYTKGNPEPTITYQEPIPECCFLVPVLYKGIFSTEVADDCIDLLRINGSVASPGFMKPEGIIIYHTAANHYFKQTLENDETPKGKQK